MGAEVKGYMESTSVTSEAVEAQHSPNTTQRNMVDDFGAKRGPAKRPRRSRRKGDALRLAIVVYVGNQLAFFGSISFNFAVFDWTVFSSQYYQPQNEYQATLLML